MSERDVVIVSNRGPRSGDAGGLVASLLPAVAGTGATWLAASDIDIDAHRHRQYYDVVSNATLWFLYHGLWDLPRRPRFDRHWREAWDGYRDVNHAFADAVADAAPDGALVLVQDYHLSLLGARLAEKRPDLSTVHFHHTPFCTPSELQTLPPDVAQELLAGLAGHRACGFHAARWASAFEACCVEVLGHAPPTFVAPAAPNLDDVRSVDCDAELAELEAAVGDRKLIVRVDRIELSKNIVRGFHAYDDLLRTRPEWRGRVTFAASIYPSRQSLPDYLAYAAEVEAVVERVNATWGDESWTPILLDTSDDFPRSVAALRRYDVLLVNPIRDGLNLVAKEGPCVNERDGVLVLSREAGVWDELGQWAVEAHPFDVAGTSDALGRALDLDAASRAEAAAGLRAVVETQSSRDWLDTQIAAATY